MSFDPRTLLTLKYRGRSVAVLREHCLRPEDLLSVARRTFLSLQDVPTGDIVLMAPIPECPDPEPVELSPEIWTTVCHVVYKVTMVLESEMLGASDETTACSSPISSATHIPDTKTPSSSSSTLPYRPASQPPRRESFFNRIKSSPTRPSPPIQSKTPQSALQTVNVSFPAYLGQPPVTISEPGLLGKKVSRFYELLDPKLGYSASNSFLSFGNSPLKNEQIFSDHDIISGSTILLNPTLNAAPIRGSSKPVLCRKPVLYIYPPSSLADVTVELALTSSWRFSAVHPPPQTTVPPGEPHTAQSLTWTVSAEPDGTLIDKTSGMEVSYLYWEANANAQPMTPIASRSTTPIANTEAFDPARPSVNPGDSVLLPISKVPGYLDAVLKALALHTEARTSFITYWLPDMLKHEYVSLRFIAQDAYERAASLRIAPTPDIVTRVFMLFRGVAVGDLGLWEAAVARADSADGAFWAGVVGVDATRAADSGLFRVLEWGGMEIQ